MQHRWIYNFFRIGLLFLYRNPVMLKVEIALLLFLFKRLLTEICLNICGIFLLLVADKPIKAHVLQ